MATAIGAADPVEVELKFALPPEARERLDAHPAFRTAEGDEPRHEVSAYFDTPGLALARKGISLRVRRSGGRRIQTVKLADTRLGLAARRGEWEWPVEQDHPDLSLLAATPAAHIADGALDGPLQPVFVTEITRRVRRFSLAGGTVTEAALDEGRIIAGAASAAVSELELELKGGAPGPLYRFALDLHAGIPFTIGSESKAARGFRLRTGETPAAVKAGEVALAGGMTAAEGAKIVVGAALGHLLGNEPAAAAGAAEGVHQMRVAIRRLRTVLVLFAPHLERRTTAPFQAELRRLGRVFGTARDWDVFCLETLAEAECDGIAPLRPLAEAARQAAHRDVQDELARPALTGLVLGLAAWVETAEATSAMRRSLAQIAPALLDRLARNAGKRGRHVARHSTEELHALRKALKKLRYGVDDLAGLYDRKAVHAYLRRCKDLQKRLGTINDAAVATALAERLGPHDRDRVQAVAELTGWNTRRSEKARRHLPETWHAFQKAPPFWT